MWHYLRLVLSLGNSRPASELLRLHTVATLAIASCGLELDDETDRVAVVVCNWGAMSAFHTHASAALRSMPTFCVRLFANELLVASPEIKL